VNLYFDKTSGLLLRTETMVKDEMAGGQEFTQATTFSDYKAVDGKQIPMTMKVERDGKLYVDGVTSEVKLMEKADDGTFAKP
jgi:hypothetical protein